MSMNIVKTNKGLVSGIPAKGEKYAGVMCFNSIPYAAPPVGALRFAPPQEHAPWEGVLDCAGYGHRPLQNMDTSVEPYKSDFFYQTDLPSFDEDCLYLSVATAAQEAGEKRPVFLWFHGGGLVQGWYYEPEFDPAALALKGVVVVSVGQRLGAMGYLSLPQLSAEQGGTSGNYGLMDEIAALKWVRENIAAFGGDPDHITVGGQSGGTMKSGALATAPEVARMGCVKGMIHQSPLYWDSGMWNQTVEQGHENGLALLEKLGLDKNISVEELRKLPAETFYKARVNLSTVCDGKLIVHRNQRDNMDEFAPDIDVLSGLNYGECRMEPFFTPNVQDMTAQWIYERAKQLLGDLYDEYDFEKLVQVEEGKEELTSRDLAVRGLTDGFFSGVCYNRLYGAAQAGKGAKSKCWSYIFKRATPSTPEEAGTDRDEKKHLVWHSGELWYTFGSLRESVPPARVWQQEDYAMAEMTSSYWANFIKTGDPNGKGLPVWPRSCEKAGYMELDVVPTAHEDVEAGLDELLWKFTAKRIGVEL